MGSLFWIPFSFVLLGFKLLGFYHSQFLSKAHMSIRYFPQATHSHSFLSSSLAVCNVPSGQWWRATYREMFAPDRIALKSELTTDATTATRIKRRKLHVTEYSNNKFIDVLSSLTSHKKQIVHQIGFSPLLGLSCSKIPVGLIHWIAQQFDVTTRCIKLQNGFTFQLDSFVVHQILGIPMGPKKIQAVQSEDATKKLKELMHWKGKEPTFKEIKKVLTFDLSDQSFASVFMLYVLSRFLCPSGHHRSCSLLYPIVLQVTNFTEFDWCTLILDWLVECIRKFKHDLSLGISSKIGGCVFLLMVSYFEFLITSEFSLGPATPRISLWTTNIVQSYTTLALSTEMPENYNRVPLKHVSCTPFSKSERLKKNVDQVLLPDIVDDYVRTCIPFECQNEARDRASKLCLSLQESVLTAITPVITTVACDFVRGLCQQTNVISLGNTISCFPQAAQCSDSESEDTSCDCGDDSMRTQKFDAPKSQGTLTAQGVFQSILESACSSCSTPQIPMAELNLLQLTSSSNFDDKLIISPKDFKVDPIPTDHLRSEDVLSLNERCLCKRIPPQFSPTKQFPPFNIMLDEDMKTPDNSITPVPMDDTDPFWVSAFEIADKVVEAHKLTSSSKKQSPYVHNTVLYHADQGTREDKSYLHQQVIFPTETERMFYPQMTQNVTRENKKRESVFKLDGVWLDKNIFGWSMRSNGWIHIHVMDAYAKMIVAEQRERARLDKLHDKEIVKHILISKDVALLTNNELIHNDHRFIFSEANIGFRLPNVGLVFIPCCIGRQWFAVCANFIDARFDVISSAITISDEIKCTISTIVYNFKSLFLLAYTRCPFFDIRNFMISYADLPKQKSINDSGVFLIRFFQTYNRARVPTFSNVDIQAIREILVFQLATFPYSRDTLPIASKFKDEYFKNLSKETDEAIS
ncbi:hypothetical protein ACP4OV_008857 [Aristida adscensionis]